MSEARLANGTDSGSPVPVAVSLLGLLLYLFGLFGTCLLAWWGTAILGSWSTSSGGFGFGDLRIAALPYVCAWMILTFRSFPKAVVAALVFPFVMGMTWSLGLIVGLLSFMVLLGILGFLVAAGATGAVLLGFQRFDRLTKFSVWAPIHVLGLGIAGLGLWAAFFGAMEKPFTPETFPRRIAPLAAALLVHALWSWSALRQEERARVSPLRVVSLLGAVYLGIGFAYIAIAPGRTLTTWPAAP